MNGTSKQTIWRNRFLPKDLSLILKTNASTVQMFSLITRWYFRFPDLINRIVLDLKDRNWEEYNYGIGASEDALKAGISLYRISESTLFLVKSVKSVEPIILDGQAHISEYHSSDFLMFATEIKGVTVESRLNEFKMQSIIGPNIRMETTSMMK